ncbi:MAG: site-2 protease family protein [Candidatus Aenigmarchaeota archaeon]|nr:site-2 protease family protein [Candidatus Aenigmarchaeota archaeon]
MFDPYMVSVIAFFAAIAVLIFLKRKKVKQEHYILFMYRTKRFSKIIDRIAGISPRFWKIFSTVGVVLCFCVMVFGTAMLFKTSWAIGTGLIKKPAFALVLPSISSDGSAGPGYILIPFWFWLITIFSILVPHELCHGIISRAHKIRLKSVGLLLLGIFPGAFVEPDEKQLEREKILPRLRVFAAGSYANFCTAIAIILLLNFIIWPAFTEPGIMLTEVNETSPAWMAGLKPGMMITEINGKTVSTTYFENIMGKGYLADETGETNIGDVIKAEADGKIYEVELAEHPETKKPYMGIFYKPLIKHSYIFGVMISLLGMIWALSFAVGVVNILPLYPLDGGLMVNALARKFFKKNSKKIVKIVSIATLILILFNFLGPYLMRI